jgi:hypothetical protein
MNAPDYRALLVDAMDQFTALMRERDKIDVEMGRLSQFIAVTYNMLALKDRIQFNEQVEEIKRVINVKSVSLTDEIRKILQTFPQDWFTATLLRDKLIASGFDFSLYATNPLSSISTVLRRMKPEEVETTTVDGGVAAYRCSQQFAKADAIRRIKLRRAFGQPEQAVPLPSFLKTSPFKTE